MKIFIEGSDGCGKSTLVKSLKKLGYDAYDRGGLTKTTLDGVNRYNEGEIYILLEASTSICRKRLAAAGKDLNEEWHTEDSINYYWKKFLEYAPMYKAFIISSEWSARDTLNMTIGAIDSIWVSRAGLVDLAGECLALSSNTIQLRNQELANRLPSVGLVAFGGLPFFKKNGQFEWCNQIVKRDTLSNYVKKALGVSSLLTYTNKNNMTLLDLGKLCLDKGHLWGLHWVTASLSFANHSPAVELAFARDTRFKLSWTVQDAPNKVFVATAGLKEWMDYLKHHEDTSFDSHTRKAMTRALVILNDILL